ncbi:hypothetical protein [Halomonas sp. NO4]|uniref:hypothetical protein n=1 Tax=Halomonas sp. NO4 TaxID=2484813 RepID=UPI0013CFE11B|nr:hypothetical protein [Halomonas sp. NO4]
MTMDDPEYTETLASIRHYSNTRFALLTLFVTATAGLVVAVFGSASTSSIHSRQVSVSR